MPNESKTFPADRRDALALLYVQNQDLTGKSPEDIVSMYHDAYLKISDKFSEIRAAEVEERRKSRSNGSMS